MSDKDQSSELTLKPDVSKEKTACGVRSAQQGESLRHSDYLRRKIKNLESNATWKKEPLGQDPFQKPSYVWRIPKHYSIPGPIVEECLKLLFPRWSDYKAKHVGRFIFITIVALLITGLQIGNYVVFELPRNLSRVCVTSQDRDYN